MQTSKFNGLKVQLNNDGVSFNHPDYPQYSTECKLWSVGFNNKDTDKWQAHTLKDNIKMFKPQMRLVIVVDMNTLTIVDAEVWDKYGNEYKYAQADVENRYIIGH